MPSLASQLLPLSPLDIELKWTAPIPVRKERGRAMAYLIDLELVPAEPGVYIFGRQWGTSFEALYVGQAGRLRGRIRTHLNNAKLLRHLAEARNGKKVVVAGAFLSKRGQNEKKCLGIAERALIRHFLAKGHDLVNKQGTRIRRHRIASIGSHPRRFWPGDLQVEKRKGE